MTLFIKVTHSRKEEKEWTVVSLISYENHLNATTPRMDLRKYMPFKVVKELNLIGAMKTFTKPHCNICMEERLTTIKKIREKDSRS